MSEGMTSQQSNLDHAQDEGPVASDDKVGVLVKVRTHLFNVALAVWTVGLGILALPFLLMPRKMLGPPVRLWARGALSLAWLICGIRWRVEGREHLPAAGGLMVGRHESAWDTIIFLLYHRDPAYVLKKELLSIPFYGWFARKVGMISVDRSAGSKALRGLVKDAKAAIDLGRAVIIFPEGTRMKPGVTRKLQPGAAALYESAGVPVVFFSLASGHVWNTRFKRPGVIRLRIHPPVPPALSRAEFLAKATGIVHDDSRHLAQSVGAVA